VRRLITTATLALAMVMMLGTAALAVHEANNQFDLAATGSLPEADGSGYSNYNAGTDGWKNFVRLSGLAPHTTYDWRGIGGGQNVIICSVTTDANGSGSCRSEVNSFLGVTEVRDAATGEQVLFARDFQDEDQKVSDGEIERRGACRDESNARCTAPGRG
jgi:hypothetical protein